MFNKIIKKKVFGKMKKEVLKGNRNKLLIINLLFIILLLINGLDFVLAEKYARRQSC